jgi:hypothetical protein
MADDRIKLVYIASSGRSGSTLLELLLGTHPRVWTTGEFYVLPFALESPGKPCGCGSPVARCPFWGPIVAAADAGALGASVGRFRDGYEVGRLLRYGELPFVLTRSAGGAVRRNEARRFGQDNAAVLAAVLDRAREFKGPQVTWLVDASKSLYRLLWLRQCERFDLRVVHLVKDPRAFVYSISKGSGRAVAGRKAARAALRWNVENFLFDRLFRQRFDPSQVLRIRYEDLASATDRVLGDITAWLGLPADRGAVNGFRAGNHGIAGNPMRHESNGIRLDEKWRSELPPGVQRMVRTLSLGLSRKYGFQG